AHRFAQPGGAPRHYLGSWRRLFRQFPKQLVVSHHSLRQPICLENHIRVSLGMKKSHSLVGWVERKRYPSLSANKDKDDGFRLRSTHPTRSRRRFRSRKKPRATFRNNRPYKFPPLCEEPP